MAEQQRRSSSTGFFHVVMRGNGKQILFEERADYRMFLHLLEEYSKETDVTVSAYCLMDNHVHLLICDKGNNMSVMMQKLGISYARYYNGKYERTGHLFQNRYRSEPVENELYLLTVFRYILNNPRKAGICPASAYEWSSYWLYQNDSSFVDTRLFRKMIGDKVQYRRFINAENEDECLEYSNQGEEMAHRVMSSCLGCRSGTVLLSYDRAHRNEAIRKLRGHGLSVRQIERMTGISRSVIQRVAPGSAYEEKWDT